MELMDTVTPVILKWDDHIVTYCVGAVLHCSAAIFRFINVTMMSVLGQDAIAQQAA